MEKMGISFGRNYNTNYHNNYYNNKKVQKTKGDELSYSDGNVTLKASLLKGHGIISKGIINKTKYLDFKLYIGINEGIYKIKNMSAHLVGRDGLLVPLKVKTGTNSLCLPISSLKTNDVRVKVEVLYRIPRIGEKKIAVTVYRGY